MNETENIEEPAEAAETNPAPEAEPKTERVKKDLPKRKWHKRGLRASTRKR